MIVWATVITDASFCDRTNKAGWAAWINIDGRGSPIKEYGSFNNHISTSTEAEKKAAINGMWIAKRYGADAILLQSDCMSVIHLLDGTTKKASVISEWNCWIEKSGLLGVHVRGKHVKGHTKVNDARSYVNRWCDRHANIGRKGLQ